MKLVKQRGFNCIIASLAMVWEIPFEEVVKLIGHAGTALVYHESDRPYVGIHSQEVLDAATKRGYAMNVIQFYPVQGPGDGKGSKIVWSVEDCFKRFRDYIISKDSVLIGETKAGRPHAVAFDTLQIFDPSCEIQSISDFEIREAWQFYRIL